MFALESNRLRLRELRQSDVKAIGSFYAEKESQPFILRHQRDPDKLGRIYNLLVEHSEKLIELGILHLAVELRDTGEVIGICSVSNARAGKMACLGWHYGACFSGFGYATEAAGVLIRHGWDVIGVSGFYADCFETNGACLRIFQKLGMLPVPYVQTKKYLYPLLFKEWRPIVRWKLARE